MLQFAPHLHFSSLFTTIIRLRDKVRTSLHMVLSSLTTFVSSRNYLCIFIFTFTYIHRITFREKYNSILFCRKKDRYEWKITLFWRWRSTIWLKWSLVLTFLITVPASRKVGSLYCRPLFPSFRNMAFLRDFFRRLTPTTTQTISTCPSHLAALFPGPLLYVCLAMTEKYSWSVYVNHVFCKEWRNRVEEQIFNY